MTRRTICYVAADGKYLGSWQEPLAPPAGAIAVPHAPEDARQIWDGTAWSAPPVDPAPLTIEGLAEALRKKGVLTPAEIDRERGKK